MSHREGGNNECLMISTKDCKKVLNNTCHQYTDEEITLIRDFLYQLATFEIKQINKI